VRPLESLAIQTRASALDHVHAIGMTSPAAPTPILDGELETAEEERSTMAGSTSETPVLDLLATMTAESIEASSLDPETLALVRIAALVAVDAAPISYLTNLAVAGEIGIDAEQVRGVLAAVAPIVGTARVASATGNIARALEVAIEVAEFEEEDADQ
jgi:4-carboxymuconolactone decarboxylase